MASYLITGGTRGLGLAMVKLLLEKTAKEVSVVIATFRKESPALQKLVLENKNRLHAVPMDVTDPESIRTAKAQIEDITTGVLDVLINNAGVMTETKEGVAAMTDLVSVFNANVNSVHMVTSAFLPHLKRGKEKKIMNISSAMGSMTLAGSFTYQPTPAYKISKAALNMLTVQYALDLGKEGLIFLAVNPGWLQTDMGSSAADLPVEKGAYGVLEILRCAVIEDNGKFFNISVPSWTPKPGQNEYTGGCLPW